MSTIVRLPNQQDATLPKRSYLNQEYGLKSWLLTGADQMPDAIPDTSSSTGMGPSPQ